VLFVAEVQQGAEITISLEDNVSSLTAIAAVGTAFGHKLLPPEAHATAPAIPSLNVNVRFIDKH
jgi:hypothetical protein